MLSFSHSKTRLLPACLTLSTVVSVAIDVLIDTVHISKHERCRFLRVCPLSFWCVQHTWRDSVLHLCYNGLLSIIQLPKMLILSFRLILSLGILILILIIVTFLDDLSSDLPSFGLTCSLPLLVEFKHLLSWLCIIYIHDVILDLFVNFQLFNFIRFFLIFIKFWDILDWFFFLSFFIN